MFYYEALRNKKMDSSGEKTIWVLAYDSQKDDFNIWARTCMAQAIVKGYNKALTTDFDGSETKEELEKMNDSAYDVLILACLDQGSFNIVDTSVSTKFPKGDASKACEGLEELFQPEDGQILVQIKQ